MPFVTLSAFGTRIDFYNFSQLTGLAFWEIDPAKAKAPGSDGVVELSPPPGGTAVWIHHGFNAPLYLKQPTFQRLLFEAEVQGFASHADAQAAAPEFAVQSNKNFSLAGTAWTPTTLAHFKTGSGTAVYTGDGPVGASDGFIGLLWRNKPFPVSLDSIGVFHDR